MTFALLVTKIELLYFSGYNLVGADLFYPIAIGIVLIPG